MKLRTQATAATLLIAMGAALPSIAAAQAGSGLTWPHQRGFWGHAGISVGGSELKADCSGPGCDDTDQTWRIYGGGRFNNTFGGEIGYVDFGDFRGTGGTSVDAKGLDLTLMAGIPFGNNWSVFGKLGTVYSRTDITGAGKDSGWGPRVGIGLQAGITQNWAIRADLDRYRLQFAGGDEDVDTFTVGAQYSFR